MKLRNLIIFCFLFLSMVSCKSDIIYIRLNQVAFGKNDIKKAVVLSNIDLKNEFFTVISSGNGDDEYSGKVRISKGDYGEYDFIYEINFSNFKKPGLYRIKIKDKKSYSFEIGTNSYDKIVNDLLTFFKIQRCGFTDPYLHEICHKADATYLMKGNSKIEEQYDVTGGWHDAGDYVKFLNTTAYSTYLLMFAYEFDPDTFGADNNNDGIPDILEEAKIGLDWLLRANYQDELLVSEVQDMKDHTVGWRKPEDDKLEFDRPGYLTIGKNLIGIYSAALATGARIWKDVIHYYEYSDQCLKTAEIFYNLKDTAPDLATGITGMYLDQHFKGKIGLGAIELYLATSNKKYLDDAKNYADEAGADYWWSWGNINSLLHYKLGSIDKKYIDYITQNLEFFKKISKNNIFGEGAAYSWGTNSTLMGVAMQSIIWEKLTGNRKYRNLAVKQRDYVLGKNPWGISFIYGFGTNFARNFHHQVAFFNDNRLPGGFAAGPVKKEFMDNYDIKYESTDRFSRFQTDSAFYRDDRMDYVTNEPTITAAATAVFVMGYFSSVDK